MKQARQNYTGIHQLIEERVSENPDRIALTYNRKTLTYKMLNEQANQLAHYLLALGVTNGSMVAISLDRSFQMVISLLAILKVGAIYVAIDSNHPVHRIDYILKDSEASVLLAQEDLAKNYSYSGKSICFHRDSKLLESYPVHNPDILFPSHSNAYLLYTSGSSGKPKGVIVNHLNLLHAYLGWKEVYDLGNQHVHFQMANFAFDVFTGDVVRSLCTGATLVLCPSEILLQPEKLYELMMQVQATCAEFVPTVLRRLLDYIEISQKTLPYMRLLICGSDNWAIHEYSRLQQVCGPQTRVINSYGLTEATIDSTYFEEAASDLYYSSQDSVPIGKPFPGTEIFILDDKMKPVINGVTGEIYVGGAGVAQGYWKRPDLTAQKFLHNPFSLNPNDRLYKTGDLGRYLPTGHIELLGRIDSQIKLRGMRIELTDIENSLNHHPAISESLVTLAGDSTTDKRLVAYIVLEHGSMPKSGDLRSFLQQKLPHYMIPAWFVVVDSIPITSNGKLDRSIAFKKVKLMNTSDIIAPRNLIEKELLIIWQKLLGIQTVSVEDNFYDLGGDSLLLARLLVEVENEFLLEINPCQASELLTIAALAEYIMKG